MNKRQDGFGAVIALIVVLVIALLGVLVYVYISKTSNQYMNKVEDSKTKTDTSKTQSTDNSTTETDTDITKVGVLLLIKGAYDKYFDAMKSSDASAWTSGRAEFEKNITTELADEWESATIVMVDPILCIQAIPVSSHLEYSDVTLNGNMANIVVTGVFNTGTQYASEKSVNVIVNTLTNKIASITCG